jgi:hypothetical protein
VNQFMRELDAACPGFVPDAGDVELPYIWMGDFVRHVIVSRLAGREADVRAVFAVIERCIATIRPGWEPSAEANLAVVGFLEDLQNGNLHPEGSSPSDFRPYLGPRSLEQWDGLNGFWEMVAGAKPV